MSSFKGKWMVGVREFYEKDGQMLVRAKAATPCTHGPLPQCVGGGLQLAPRMLVAPPSVRPPHPLRLRTARASHLHMQTAQSHLPQPGKKGISLPEEQWARLLAGLPGLAAALEAA